MSQVATDADRARRGARVIAFPPAQLACSEADTVVTVCLDGEKPEYLARRAVTAILARLAVSPERRDDAELAVSELVANAGRHAPGPRELRVRVCAEAVTFAVADGGDDHVAIARMLAAPGAAVEWFEEDGRGLQIVASLFPEACGARACGAGPAGAGRGDRRRRLAAVNGSEPAKEVWVSIALT